jgi:hypothetical protein
MKHMKRKGIKEGVTNDDDDDGDCYDSKDDD